jgi:ABC-2 type transport system permease protein
MRKLLNISEVDLRIFFKSRGNWVGLVVIPVVMTLVVGVFTAQRIDEAPHFTIDVIDSDESEISAQFVQALRETGASLHLCPMDRDIENTCGLESDEQLDRESAASRVKDGTTEAAIIIPPDFAGHVRQNEATSIVLLVRQQVPGQSIVEQAVISAIQNVEGASSAARTGADLLDEMSVGQPEFEDRESVNAAIYARAIAYWKDRPARVTLEFTTVEGEEPAGINLQDGLGQSVPGMGSMFVMFTVFGGMVTLIHEREDWTLQRLIMMPIGRGQLLGGKITGRFTLGLIQYLIVFAVGLAAGLYFGSDLLAIVFVMLSFTLCVTALSFAIGSRLDSAQQASGLSLLLGITLASLGGAWWPLEIVPEFMQVIGHLSPVAWAMDAYHILIFQGGTFADVWVSVAVLLGMTMLFFVLGTRQFRYG